MDKIFRSKIYSNILNVTYFYIFSYFFLNFIGSPLLKPFYIFSVILTLYSIIRLKPHESILIFFAYTWIEGQGRILWNYAPWSRIVFDTLLSLLILKGFITYRKFFNFNRLPKWVILSIICHFCIFLIQVFNPDSVGPEYVITTMKIYIVPILLFLFFILILEDFRNATLEDTVNLTFVMIALQAALVIFQMYFKEDFLLKISPFYTKALKENIFTSAYFRPTGTSFVAGGPSTYFFLCFPILILNKDKLKYSLFLFPLVMLAMYFLQVRSATLKLILIIFSSLFFMIISSKNKLKQSFKLTFLLFIILSFSWYTVNKYIISDKKLNLDVASSRLSKLTQKNQRISATDFFNVITDKLKSKPFGTGPGLTGAAASLGINKYLESAFTRASDVWAYDNLFISIAIDFGFTGIFYILIVLAFPLSLLLNQIKLFWSKQKLTSNISHIATPTILVILFGNWGAVGLPYNPESFFFWFWLSLASISHRNLLNMKESTINTGK